MSRKMKPELTHGKIENWNNIIAKKQNLYLKRSSLKKQTHTHTIDKTQQYKITQNDSL